MVSGSGGRLGGRCGRLGGGCGRGGCGGGCGGDHFLSIGNDFFKKIMLVDWWSATCEKRLF